MWHIRTHFSHVILAYSLIWLILIQICMQSCACNMKLLSGHEMRRTNGRMVKRSHRIEHSYGPQSNSELSLWPIIGIRSISGKIILRAEEYDIFDTYDFDLWSNERVTITIYLVILCNMKALSSRAKQYIPICLRSIHYCLECLEFSYEHHFIYVFLPF